MKSSITVYGTQEEIDRVVAYHKGQLNGHPLPRHMREFHSMLVALSESKEGIPDTLIRRYGWLYETYCNPNAGEQLRAAMRKAVEACLMEADIDANTVLDRSRPILDAA